MADAHHLQAEAAIDVIESGQQLGQQAGTGGAQRVTVGNRATPGVELVHVGIELARPGQRHAGKGLVDLDPVHVSQTEAGLLQRSARRRNHASELQHRVGAHHHAGAEAGARAQAMRFGRGATGQQHGRGPIGHLAGIGSRDHALLLAAEHRGHGGHLLDIDHGTHAFIVLQTYRLTLGIDAGHRYGTAGQAGLLRGMGTAMAFAGKVVAIGTAELPLLGNALGAFHLVRDGKALQNARMQIVKAGEGLPAQRQVQEHGHAAHAFHTAADGEVQIAGGNRLRCRMYGVLAGAAHAVQADAGHAGRQAGQQHRLACNIGTLLASLADTAGNHVTNLLGRHGGLRQYLLQHAGQQCVGARFTQGPLALAEWRAHGTQNHGIVRSSSHVGSPCLGAQRPCARWRSISRAMMLRWISLVPS